MSSTAGDQRKEGASCPFSSAQKSAAGVCPVSTEAAGFDPFQGAYQISPADALRWSRDREPVFYSPRLGYWVVSRFEDIKAIFRDNMTFSPENVLEKITPFSQEATRVLETYNYGMKRTLVNEDEPAHMERRRALLDHFLPENLAEREDAVRRLTREKVDAFIDKGRIDLVDAMLWEIPLTVALHFLGIPEEDMDTLRQFSIAHTVNTWGRPSPEQQVEVAHAVGRFWQYAGEILDKMRKQPDGQGWMHFAIRKNKDIPEVVTDSYLHSMMMAIIVAAHETTAHASANAIQLLLTHRQAWDDICANPKLIPNAVEECLRYSGSVVAWRRKTTRDVEIGGIHVPQGAKLLMVTASANHDPRHFDDADSFDIYRENAVDHLTFGYGSHQCMGKNLARMEMRIFLEEFTRRLPHMRLVEGQTFSYLPNTSFRGPDHLWVEWNPQENPERSDRSSLEPKLSFAVGAPLRREIARAVEVLDVCREAENIIGVTLADPSGRSLPAWTAGAHIELVHEGVERKYSLCGPRSSGHYHVAILHAENGTGGSKHFHKSLQKGSMLEMRGPRTHFRLNEVAHHHVLIAGGIGITPIIAMADQLKLDGKSYEIHYAGRSRRLMAFLDRLVVDHANRVALYVGDKSQRMNLAALMAAGSAGTQFYACGPDRMISELEALAGKISPDLLRFEYFAAAPGLLSAETEKGFEVELADSGMTVLVPPERTMLAVLRSAGIDIPSDCEEGLCGTCEVEVLAGEIDHRDRVLTAAERASQTRMLTCCSRARNGGRLKIAQ